MSCCLNADFFLNKILFDNYKIQFKLGEGSFGYLFQGIDVKTNEKVAIKIEKNSDKYIVNNEDNKKTNEKNENIKVKINFLEKEAYFLNKLKGNGIPKLIFHSSFQNFYVIIETLLGDSLEKIFEKNNRKLELKDVCLIGIQVLERLEFIHKKGVLHRDIKPDNFVVGRPNTNIIYMIDFGLSKNYIDESGKHIEFKVTRRLTGTARFASINALRGYEKSRRDDLEAMTYMLIYFVKGRLPWQGLKAKTKEERYKKIYQMKKSIPPKKLCENLPEEFVRFLCYNKELGFDENPDYSYLRDLLDNILENRIYTNSIDNKNTKYDFSWNKKLIYSKHIFGCNQMDLSVSANGARNSSLKKSGDINLYEKKIINNYVNTSLNKSGKAKHFYNTKFTRSINNNIKNQYNKNINNNIKSSFFSSLKRHSILEKLNNCKTLDELSGEEKKHIMNSNSILNLLETNNQNISIEKIRNNNEKFKNIYCYNINLNNSNGNFNNFNDSSIKYNNKYIKNSKDHSNNKNYYSKNNNRPSVNRSSSNNRNEKNINFQCGLSKNFDSIDNCYQRSIYLGDEEGSGNINNNNNNSGVNDNDNDTIREFEESVRKNSNFNHSVSNISKPDISPTKSTIQNLLRSAIKRNILNHPHTPIVRKKDININKRYNNKSKIEVNKRNIYEQKLMFKTIDNDKGFDNINKGLFNKEQNTSVKEYNNLYNINITNPNLVITNNISVGSFGLLNKNMNIVYHKKKCKGNKSSTKKNSNTHNNIKNNNIKNSTKNTIKSKRINNKNDINNYYSYVNFLNSKKNLYELLSKTLKSVPKNNKLIDLKRFNTSNNDENIKDNSYNCKQKQNKINAKNVKLNKVYNNKMNKIQNNKNNNNNLLNLIYSIKK